jgi:hypothetical protein
MAVLTASWKGRTIFMKICEETMAETGRQHWEGLLIAAEYTRTDKISREQGYMELNY